jgi:ATP-dependent Clp protease ATP-binding subunit ClpC
MLERLTPPARRVLVGAQEQARLLGHGFIDTEHLLLGLIEVGEGTAARALLAAGADADAMRAMLSASGPTTTDTQGPLSAGTSRSASPDGRSVEFSRLGKLALERSLREALALGDGFIGTEHLLLGLFQLGASGAMYLLRAQGIDPARVSAEVFRLRMEAGRPPPRSRPRLPRPPGPRAWPRLSRRRQWPGP